MNLKSVMLHIIEIGSDSRWLTLTHRNVFKAFQFINNLLNTINNCGFERR
jgi:hypothetical protein